MIKTLYRLAQFVIYSSLNVSVAAALFSAETFAILEREPEPVFILFVFFSTMLTYSIHRYVGIAQLDEGLIKGRFLIIKKYRSLIGITALLSLFALGFLATKMSLLTLALFGISGIICFLYVIPVMHRKRRLRDIPFIKIVLIAFSWAFVAHIPLAESIWTGQDLVTDELLLSAGEKFIYIILITLPFDIRDLELDRSMDVSTFPGRFGIIPIYRFIYLLLAIDMVLLLLMGMCASLEWPGIFLLVLSVLLSLAALNISRGKASDIYYSGHLDGVIILRSLCIIAAFYWF